MITQIILWSTINAQKIKYDVENTSIITQRNKL